MSAKWNEVSKYDQAAARAIAVKLHEAGMAEATVSQVARELETFRSWEQGWIETARLCEMMDWPVPAGASEEEQDAEFRATLARRRAEAEAASAAPQAHDDEPQTPQAAVATARAAGWTARKLAAEVGVHVSTVYRWAAGTRTPTTVHAAALAALVRA